MILFGYTIAAPLFGYICQWLICGLYRANQPGAGRSLRAGRGEGWGGGAKGTGLPR